MLDRQRSERLQSALFHIAQLATADIDESEFYEHVHAAVGGNTNITYLYDARLTPAFAAAVRACGSHTSVWHAVEVAAIGYQPNTSPVRLI